MFPKKHTNFKMSTKSLLVHTEKSRMLRPMRCVWTSAAGKRLLTHLPPPSAKSFLLSGLLHALDSICRKQRVLWDASLVLLTLVFLLFLTSAIDGFLKTDERQRLAKERREEREKYLGKMVGSVCIIHVYMLLDFSYMTFLMFWVLNTVV